MEPAFQRGDILFLNNQDDNIRVGEIVVFKIKGREIPIVHRILKVHERYTLLNPSSLDVDMNVTKYCTESPHACKFDVDFLTKGDANQV